MNKEIAQLLKSNRRIINITPEDVIDVESKDTDQNIENKSLPQNTTDLDSTS